MTVQVLVGELWIPLSRKARTRNVRVKLGGVLLVECTNIEDAEFQKSVLADRVAYIPPSEGLSILNPSSLLELPVQAK